MTKDGRPSSINDIRYFNGTRDTYLEGHKDAVAFGRRVAWFLNGEGFSCGAYPSLYILLTSSLRPGEIRVTNDGGDWWQRYTHVGVPKDFPNVPDASELVKCGTVAALKTIRPDLTTIVEDAEKMVRTHGDDLRFLLQTHQTKRYVVDVYFNIPVGPEPAYLFTALTDRDSGEFLEGPPLPTGSLGGAPFDYKGPIKITEIEKTLSDFVPKERPIMSKLVKRR